MAVEKPTVALSQEPFGSAFPETDAFSTEGGVFNTGAPIAPDTPCEMVSIATTKEDIPISSRNWTAWPNPMPDDNLNKPY